MVEVIRGKLAYLRQHSILNSKHLHWILYNVTVMGKTYNLTHTVYKNVIRYLG